LACAAGSGVPTGSASTSGSDAAKEARRLTAAKSDFRMDLEKRLKHLKWIGNDDRLDNKKWEDISSEKTELYEVRRLQKSSCSSDLLRLPNTAMADVASSAAYV